MLHHPQKITGFTVVELMVVIIIIGIIATIGTVSFNHVLVSARNTDRLNELKAWEHAFTLYANFERSYPNVPADNRGYCLGTSFPTAAELAPYTGSITPPSPDGYCGRLLETSGRYIVNEGLNAKLLKITDKNPGSDESKDQQFRRWQTAIGPYAMFTSGTITLSSVFEGTRCPDGTTLAQTYSGAKRVVCSITLPDNYSYEIVP